MYFQDDYLAEKRKYVTNGAKTLRAIISVLGPGELPKRDAYLKDDWLDLMTCPGDGSKGHAGFGNATNVLKIELMGDDGEILFMTSAPICEACLARLTKAAGGLEITRVEPPPTRARAQISPEGLATYGGVPLAVPECEVLEEIEQLIGAPLPLEKDTRMLWTIPSDLFGTSWGFFGFHAREGHVTALGIRATEELISVPESIGKLRYLRGLDLSNGSDFQWTSLPEVIGDLNRLEFLSLAYNNLKTIPD